MKTEEKPKTKSQLRILFLVPQTSKGACVTDHYSLADTIAFRCLAGYAKQHAGEPERLVFAIERFSSTLSAKLSAREFRPHIVGFSCYLHNIKANLDAAQAVKCDSPDTVTILGGPEVIDSEAILQTAPFIDAVFRGEAEASFLAFVKTFLEGTRNFGSTPCISFRRGDEIISTPDEPPVSDLDTIPSIFTEDALPELKNIVLYETSRGCRRRCRFCTWTSRFRRPYSLERVERDLEKILAQPAVKRVYITDAEFCEDPERAKSILKIIKKHNTRGIEFSCFMNFEDADEELLAMCRELNFPAEVPFGLQTTNTAALKAIGRGWFDIDSFTEKLHAAFAYVPPGRFVVDLIYGLPGDDYEGFKNTLRWCLDNGFSRMNFFRLGGFPGTEFRKHAERYGLVFSDDTPYLVARSDTFSQQDIAKTETLIRNFQVFAGFLSPEDYAELKKSGVDWLDTIEDIHNCTPDWNTKFTAVDESNIAGVDTSVLLPALDFLKGNIPPEAFQHLYRRWLKHIT